MSVAAGSLVIISDEDPHSGTELNGTTSTASPPPPVPTPDPAQVVPAATGTTPGSTSAGSATPGSTTPPVSGTTPGTNAGSGATSNPSTTPPPPVPAPIPIPTPTLPPTPAVPPLQPPAGANPAPSPVVTPPTIGSGPDTMVLTLSEDAYKGDAQFVFTVDGKPVGPAQTVTAPHSQGQSEAFTIKGDWGAGSHQFGVSFVNDLWDGTPSTDRNLYIDRATFNGSPVQNAVALWGNDTVPFGTASAPQPPSQTTKPGTGGAAASKAGAGGAATPPTIGSGPDTVTLNVSEDAYKGNAQFVFTVDGKPVGPTQTVTALHSQGQSETFTFKGDWAAGAHQFGVRFVNDLWNGTPATDRNLYVNSATFDAGQVENPVTLFTNSAALFGTAPIMEPPSPPGSTSQTGTAVGKPPASDTVAAIDSQTLAFGSGTQGMTFASPQNLTITGGPGTDTVTATAGTNTFIAGTGSMDITGGSGASNFVLHAGGGKLTVEDFQLGKGDALTVDKALQANLKQASDGHGGTLLTFGANQGSIDLIGYPATSPLHVTFA